MSSPAQPIIPNPYNQILGQKHAMMARALRFALAPDSPCNRLTNQPILSSPQLRRQLKTVQINTNTAGDSIIIPALAGVKQIFEIVLWNVGAQTLIIQQGGTGTAQRIQLLKLTNFPALTGYTLGFNGNFDMPHWEIDNGQSLTIVLAAATQVDGFVRYRVANGTN